MSPSTRINKISLINFKNHLHTTLTDLKPFVVLNGDNGSGKTNILEAISFFAPGRGLKNTRFIEIPNKNGKKKNFEIKINVKYDLGEIELIRSFSDEDNKNFILADNEKISNFQLLDFLNILWITPIMEKVMLQSNSEKRNFFDRLIFNLNQNHIKNYSKLQNLLSERLALLKRRKYDDSWLSIVEENIACLSVKLLSDRTNFILQLNENLKKVKSPLNACHIDIYHEILKLGEFKNPEALLDLYKANLNKNR